MDRMEFKEQKFGDVLPNRKKSDNKNPKNGNDGDTTCHLLFSWFIEKHPTLYENAYKKYVGNI